MIDPHRMMQTCGLTDGFIRTGMIASTYGQVSVNATRCSAPGAGGTHHLPQLVDPTKVKRSKRIFRKVNAKVASGMGLVGRAVPSDSLTEEEARALTGMIAANNSRTLGHGKAAVDLNPETTIGQRLHYETVANGATHASEDYEIDLSPSQRSEP